LLFILDLPIELHAYGSLSKFTWSGAQVGSGLVLSTPGASGLATSVGTAETTNDNAHIYGSTFANGQSSSTHYKVENGMSTGSTVTINKREPKFTFAQVGSGLGLATPGAIGQSESVGTVGTTNDNAHVYGQTFANGQSSSTHYEVKNGQSTGSTITVNKREPKFTSAQVGSGLGLTTPGAIGQSESVGAVGTTNDNAHVYGQTFANGQSSSTHYQVKNDQSTGSTISVNKREPKFTFAQVGSGLGLATPGAIGQSESVGTIGTTNDNAHVYGQTFANGHSSSTHYQVENGQGTGSTIIVN
jgi:hypothetical protein